MARPMAPPVARPMAPHTVQGDADLAAVGSILADRARCRILLALADGRSLPASMLASEAGVAASTASSHLGRLVDAGLVRVTAKGRYRYYRLAGPEVGELIEVVGRVAPAEPVRSLRQGTRAYQLRRARTCYDHLAGRLGVAVTAGLVDCGGLVAGGSGDVAAGDGAAGDGAAALEGYTLSTRGRDLMNHIGADLDAGSWVRCCVDWTEQRHHMAGPHGRAVLGRMVDLGWIRRAQSHRAVQLTDRGRDGLAEWIGLDVTGLDATGLDATG